MAVPVSIAITDLVTVVPTNWGQGINDWVNGAYGVLGATYTAAAFNAATGGFPAGTRSVFVQAAAPTGWVIDAACNDQVLMAMNAAGNSTGGSWTISGLPSVSGSTTLTIAQMPSHTHVYGGNTVVLTTAGAGGIEPALATSHVTAPTGGGGGHTHPLTSTGDGTWRPAWRGVIVCAKS